MAVIVSVILVRSVLMGLSLIRKLVHANVKVPVSFLTKKGIQLLVNVRLRLRVVSVAGQVIQKFQVNVLASVKKYA